MKRTALYCLLLASSFLLLSCEKGKSASTPTSANQGEVVAKVNEVVITNADLDNAVKGRLQKVDQEIYEIKKDALDELVETKLVEEAAKKQGKSDRKSVV